MSVRLRFISAEQYASEFVEANLHALEYPVMRTVDRRLVGEKVHLPRPDLEAAYNQAWLEVYRMVARGILIDSLRGLLVAYTWRRAIDIYRQRHVTLYIDAALNDDQPVKVDFTDQLDDRQKLERFFKRLKGYLGPTQCSAMALCLLCGYTRPEAARLLGLPERKFRKIMDRTTPKIATVAVQIGARGCGGEEWARALRAYALGLVATDSPDEQRIASHVEDCESCRRYTNAISSTSRVVANTFLARLPTER